MAKVLDSIAEALYAMGADRVAYRVWLRAYRLRQKSGELDE